MEYGTVKFFNGAPGKMYGFIVPDIAGRDIFFHYNNGREPQRPIHGFMQPGLIDTGKVELPKKGDRVVYNSEPHPKGPRTKLWAFEAAYKRAQLAHGIPSNDVNAPAHQGFTWNELEAVAGGIYGLMQCIPAASTELKLSNEQIGIFLRNTPDGKKGEELWKEFRRRQADKGSDEYTFITFMREVLSAAGHPVTLKGQEVTGFCPVCHQENLLKSVEPQYPDDPMLQEEHCFVLAEHKDLQGRTCDGAGKHPTAMSGDDDFDPDNDQWGPPIAHAMSHEYD